MGCFKLTRKTAIVLTSVTRQKVTIHVLPAVQLSDNYFDFEILSII